MLDEAFCPDSGSPPSARCPGGLDPSSSIQAVAPCPRPVLLGDCPRPPAHKS